jgi:Peptidase family M1 domain
VRAAGAATADMVFSLYQCCAAQAVLLPCLLCLTSSAQIAGARTATPTRSPTSGVPAVAEVVQEFRRISLDPNETYRVRDFHLERGDLKIYLAEGTISFATPVAGRSVAMVFTTAESELGDAELMVLPPRRSDRESLLRYAKTPNLSEHFTEGVFLFTDDTYAEVHRQLSENLSERTPDRAVKMADTWNPLLRNVASDMDVRLVEALLNRSNDPSVETSAVDGMFEGIVQGRVLGAFDVSFEPEQPEPLAVGTVLSATGPPHFQLWTSFKPRRSQPATRHVALSDFIIDTTIGADLKQTCVTQVSAKFSMPHIRAMRFDISERMRVTAATIDGEPAEFYQRSPLHIASDERESTVLVVASHALDPNRPHQILIRHEGTVVSQSENGVYLVAERNVWFPHRSADPASFDLTFHVPSRFEVVSIGKLIDEHVDGDTRVVHRKTETPARYAGFNFGEFEQQASTNGSYRIECYANRSLFEKLNAQAENDSKGGGSQRLNELSERSGTLLAHYTQEWGSLPLRSIAIAPIPGYFGQGFPGLIYLSTLSYLHSTERPPQARDPLTDIFFSDLLLAHEIAHQWWGNVVTSADYRSEWIMESISNYAALELVEDAKGVIVRDEVLRFYRRELTAIPRNATADPESTGPIEWGQRLIDIGGQEAWRVVTYEKGTWILHMLRERMGREAYHQMLRQIVRDFANRPLSNDDFRQVASKFMPAGEPDSSLELFFDTWVYGTGVPHLSLNTGKGSPKTAGLEQSGVPDDFTVDVPISIVSSTGQRGTRWVRSNSDGVSIPMSPGQNVELPSTADFLYIP